MEGGYGATCDVAKRIAQNISNENGMTSTVYWNATLGSLALWVSDTYSPLGYADFAVCCGVAVSCGVLQYVAVWNATLGSLALWVSDTYSPLGCAGVAVCCSLLQSGARC